MTNPRGRIAIAAAIVVLGLVAAVGGWWFGIGRYTVAPQLVAKTQAEAAQQASQAGFHLAYGDPVYNEDVAKDIVLTQDPPASERIVKGGTITLVLSRGPERYQVPDVVGKQYALAQEELQQAKFTVTKGADRYSDSLPKGVVMAVDPPVGTELKPNDRVQVILSKGPAPLKVPNVVGKSLTEARQILIGAGLQPLVATKQSDRPKDEVLKQTPVDGTGVENGAEVKLEVSEGPPMVMVQRVVGLPCQQGQQALLDQKLTVGIQGNPNGTVFGQNPPENTPVPPGTQIVLTCL